MIDVGLLMQSEYFRLLSVQNNPSIANINTSYGLSAYGLGAYAGGVYGGLIAPIVYNNSVVPVYDTVPVNATYPYIAIGDKTDVDFSNKTTQGAEITQGLSVVDRFQANTGGRNSVYSISSSIMQILTARPNPFNIEELNVVTSVLDNSLTRQELTPTYHYRIVELRYRHLIEYVGLGVFGDTFDLTFN